MKIIYLLLLSFITLTSPVITAMREESRWESEYIRSFIANNQFHMQFDMSNGTRSKTITVSIILKDNYTFTHCTNQSSPNGNFLAIKGRIQYCGDHSTYGVMVYDIRNNKLIHIDDVSCNELMCITNTTFQCYNTTIDFNETYNHKTIHDRIENVSIRSSELRQVTVPLMTHKKIAIGCTVLVGIYGIYRIIKSRCTKNNEPKPDPVLQEFLTTPIPHTTETY